MGPPGHPSWAAQHDMALRHPQHGPWGGGREVVKEGRGVVGKRVEMGMREVCRGGGRGLAPLTLLKTMVEVQFLDSLSHSFSNSNRGTF